MRNNISNIVLYLLAAIISAGLSAAFSPNKGLITGLHVNTLGRFQGTAFRQAPAFRRHQRNSVGLTQVMGLFGLGGAEIAVIVVVVAFLLGPKKIAELGKELGRDAGKLKDELKDIPKEFQKGLLEGEIDARAKKAKPMDKSDV